MLFDLILFLLGIEDNIRNFDFTSDSDKENRSKPVLPLIKIEKLEHEAIRNTAEGNSIFLFLHLYVFGNKLCVTS